MIIPTTRAEPSIEACSISGGLFRPLRLFQFHELRFRSTEQHADGVIEPGSFRFAGDIQGGQDFCSCSITDTEKRIDTEKRMASIQNLGAELKTLTPDQFERIVCMVHECTGRVRLRSAGLRSGALSRVHPSYRSGQP